MQFAVSTHWNAWQHDTGQAMLEEILELGVNRVELGYDLTLELAEGVSGLVSAGTVIVDSVHGFCPVPLGVPYGHPELFALASTNPNMRESAVVQTAKTVEFATRVGARTVVFHAGYVGMRILTPKLLTLCEKNKQYSPAFERTKMKLFLRRDKRVAPHLEALSRSIDALLPYLEQNKVTLALENLPYWEAVPNEAEMLQLKERFDTPHLMYWHDIGHGQVRQNLGFIGQVTWLERLQPFLAGMHVHDVLPPADDHLMPPRGKVDFGVLKPFAHAAGTLVLEPAPRTPTDQIREALAYLETTWGAA